MNYLYTNAKSQGQWGCESEESRVCTRIVSTGSEGIKQHEIITIRRKQGQGLMETDVGLQPKYESSGWGCMPRCPECWD